MAYQALEAEIAMVLGRGDDLVGMFNRDSLETLDRLYYQQLPGFSLPMDRIRDIPFSGEVDRELFYELDPDIFMVDPRLPVVSWGWQVDDVAEIAGRVAPFYGNFIRHPYTDDWKPEAPQYSLDEYFRRFSRLFFRENRYKQFGQFRNDFLDRLRDRLPDRKRRPKICVIGIGSEPAKDRFYLVNIREGTGRVQQYRDLGLQQAYDPDRYSTGQYGLIDTETLSEINPDVIFVLWATSEFEKEQAFRKQFVEPLKNDAVARRIKAVRDENVLPGGIGSQGPITHLFQLEKTAKQLFPEEFGEWRWDDPSSDPLFSRDALSKIIRGDTG